MLTFQLLVCLVVVGTVFGQEEVTLDIPQGSLKGLKTTTNFNSKTYYSFRGIPYAKPPIGFHKFEVSRLFFSTIEKSGIACPFFGYYSLSIKLSKNYTSIIVTIKYTRDDFILPVVTVTIFLVQGFFHLLLYCVPW